MSDALDVLKLVCHRLEQADIPYMLTGSLAANFYEVPRMTRDIDIVVELHKPDIEKVLQTFQDAFYIDKDAVVDAVERREMFNIIHNDTVFKVDFIVRKPSSYRHTEFQRKQRVPLGDTPIWIVAPEDLIISKLFWAKDSLSEMQLNDIKNLLSTVKNLDKKYIDTWIEMLGLDDLYKKVKGNA